jgi:hypothetical protein
MHQTRRLSRRALICTHTSSTQHQARRKNAPAARAESQHRPPHTVHHRTAAAPTPTAGFCGKGGGPEIAERLEAGVAPGCPPYSRASIPLDSARSCRIRSASHCAQDRTHPTIRCRRESDQTLSRGWTQGLDPRQEASEQAGTSVPASKRHHRQHQKLRGRIQPARISTQRGVEEFPSHSRVTCGDASDVAPILPALRAGVASIYSRRVTHVTIRHRGSIGSASGGTIFREILATNFR